MTSSKTASTLICSPVHYPLHRRLVNDARLEYQPKTLGVVVVDEVEVRLYGRSHALMVVIG